MMKFLLLVLAQICLLIGLSQAKKHKISLFLNHFDDPKYPLKAVALMQGPFINGVVRFTQDLRQLSVNVSIMGLSPTNTTTLKGLHIHQFAVSVPFNNVTHACATTGAHFNPQNQTHGLLDTKQRHVGDLGNVRVDLNGSISQVLIVESSVFNLWGKDSIVGRSVVLHDIEDSGLPNANFGPRIACGTIGWDRS